MEQDRTGKIDRIGQNRVEQDRIGQNGIECDRTEEEYINRTEKVI